MRLSQFLIITLFTLLATYWMNAAILSGQFFWAALYGVIVFRNLRFSYRVTKWIRMVEFSTKKRD